MRYLSVAEIAKKWDVSERSVRNYCANGRIPGAFLTRKMWNIPENAPKPERSNKKKEKKTTLLDILLDEKANKYSGGIYHKTQIDLTYNSNHMEGCRLTHDQTRYIFETNTIGIEKEVLNVDDVIETANHFRCIDMIIDRAKLSLTEKIIKELHLILKNGTDDITERLYDLLQGERVVARIDQNVVYRSLAEDPANIYSLLLVAGYLKTPKKELQADGSYLCEVSIPNREIAAVYKSEILSHFLQTGAITRTTANKIAESLYANDYKKLQSAIGEYMDKSISFFDGGAEGFYHGLMLGLIALIDNQYKIKSNRESGDGGFDVSLIPREKRYPGIILELKWKEKLSDVELEKWSNEALKQIGELRYDSEMKEDGITEILKFGIAFSGKKVCVRTE